jgi:hypothetical protein
MTKNTNRRLPNILKENMYVLKIIQSNLVLKTKLQHNKWSEPIKVSKIISPQNIEVVVNNKSKVVNVNNVKKSEFIRSRPTITRSGRISIPRLKHH